MVLASFVPAGFAQNQQNPVPKIIAALESDKKTVRLQAATALGNHGTGAREAAPALLTLMQRERDPQVAFQAVQALTQIGAHAQLRELLKHPDLPIRMQAVSGLGIIGPPAKKAIPDLLRLLRDEQPMMRCLAAGALAEIGLQTEDETRQVIALLADADPDVRPFALYAVMNLGPNSVPGLETMLSDKEPAWVRVASLQALANQGGAAKATVPTLTKMLNDPSAAIRAQTAATLAAIGSDAKEALPAILDRLMDKNARVQAQAFNAAVAVGQADRRALLDGLKAANAKGRWNAPFPLSGKAAVPGLIKDLENQDAGKRIAAALALARMGQDAETAIPALIHMAKDENGQVRSAAQQALVKLSQKERDDYLDKLRRERLQMFQDAKELKAKFAALSAKNLRDAQFDFLKKPLTIDLKAIAKDKQDAAFAFEFGSNLRLSVAMQNKPQQAYIRRLVAMHIMASVSMGEAGAVAVPDGTQTPDDWVRDQLCSMGTVAVPAFVEGLNLEGSHGFGFT
jgi:HEAT repeat protein